MSSSGRVTHPRRPPWRPRCVVARSRGACPRSRRGCWRLRAASSSRVSAAAAVAEAVAEATLAGAGRWLSCSGNLRKSLGTSRLLTRLRNVSRRSSRLWKWPRVSVLLATESCRPAALSPQRQRRAATAAIDARPRRLSRSTAAQCSRDSAAVPCAVAAPFPPPRAWAVGYCSKTCSTDSRGKCCFLLRRASGRMQSRNGEGPGWRGLERVAISF
mmetsp:Transcript_87909/g.243915  ORF Transcript_87909/g.243915 Transcript_87909/m.243915 type:complete len:215 (+) Transcript_87909:1599-2243(+)